MRRLLTLLVLAGLTAPAPALAGQKAPAVSSSQDCLVTAVAIGSLNGQVAAVHDRAMPAERFRRVLTEVLPTDFKPAHIKGVKGGSVALSSCGVLTAALAEPDRKHRKSSGLWKGDGYWVSRPIWEASLTRAVVLIGDGCDITTVDLRREASGEWRAFPVDMRLTCLE